LLIQNWNSNYLSDDVSFFKHGWYAESSASWAMDEVYDDIQGL